MNTQNYEEQLDRISDRIYFELENRESQPLLIEFSEFCIEAGDSNTVGAIRTEFCEMKAHEEIKENLTGLAESKAEIHEDMEP